MKILLIASVTIEFNSFSVVNPYKALGSQEMQWRCRSACTAWKETETSWAWRGNGGGVIIIEVPPVRNRGALDIGGCKRVIFALLEPLISYSI